MAKPDVLSFDPWPGFRLAHLGLGAHGLTAGPAERQATDDVLVDADDRRISRTGAAITWSAGTEPSWTLHLDGRPVLTRPGRLNARPADIVGAVTALRRGVPLHPVARIRRAVVTTPLLRADQEESDAAPMEVGSITEVDRSVLDGSRVVTRSRTIEIQAPAEVLDALTAALKVPVSRHRRRRDKTDSLSELRRAAGPVAAEPPDPIPPELDDGSPVGDVVRATLSRAVNRWIAADPVVRLDLDVEGVHQARVGLRTLRSDLRSFRDFLDPDALVDVIAELRWAGQALGAVRDLDVLGERLGAGIGELDGADQPAAASLLEALDDQRSAALRTVHEVLDSPRYLRLVDDAFTLATEPPLTPDADRPAEEALTDAARRSWKRLAGSARASLSDDAPIEQLHLTRIKAKRFRYAAEAAGEVLPGARSHAKRVARVQGVLGDLHDAAVLEQWLRDRLGEDGHDPFVLGQLVMRERAEIAEIRRDWPEVWKAARARSSRRWLRRS